MAGLSVLFDMAACLVRLDCFGAVLCFCAVIWALLPPVLSLSFSVSRLVWWLGGYLGTFWGHCYKGLVRARTFEDFRAFFFYLVICLDPVHVLVLVFFSRSCLKKKTLFSVFGRQLLGVIPL